MLDYSNSSGGEEVVDPKVDSAFSDVAVRDKIFYLCNGISKAWPSYVFLVLLIHSKPRGENSSHLLKIKLGANCLSLIYSQKNVQKAGKQRRMQ